MAKTDDFTDFFCKLSKIGNLPTCFLFYIVDIIVGIYFLIWGLIVKIFPFLKPIGKLLWDYVGKMIKSFWYNNWLMDTCYLCNPKYKTRKCGKSCPSGYVNNKKVPCAIIGSCRKSATKSSFSFSSLFPSLF